MRLTPFSPKRAENFMALDQYPTTEGNKSYHARLEASRDPITGRFKKGTGYPGRKKGSPNKRRPLSAQLRTDELRRSGTLTIDPIEELARIGLDERYDARTRLSAWKTLARYIYPQRKAVDVSTDAQEAISATLSDHELEYILSNAKPPDRPNQTME